MRVSHEALYQSLFIDAWYLGKHKQHGGNLQVLYDPHGFPVRVAPVESGSTHDITAARRHVFRA